MGDPPGGSGVSKTLEQVATLDSITEDLLISQTAQLEMNHWFIRAHLSDTDGRLPTHEAATQLDAATAAVYALQPAVATEEVFGDGGEDS